MSVWDTRQMIEVSVSDPPERVHLLTRAALGQGVPLVAADVPLVGGGLSLLMRAVSEAMASDGWVAVEFDGPLVVLTPFHRRPGEAGSTSFVGMLPEPSESPGPVLARSVGGRLVLAVHRFLERRAQR